MSSDPITFSVIIPVYRGEAFLAQTLNSVLGQTRAPLEILVLDDGSPDNSAEIARSFGRHVRVKRRQNCGVSATRNFGATIARGTWLAFLDQDDLWEPNFLARHAEQIQRSAAADVCYSGRRHLFDDGMGGLELTGPVPVPAPERLAGVLMERCPFTPSATVIRRSTFLRVGGFDSRHNSVEDWDLWLRLLHAGARFVSCPEPLLQYRVHPAANTNNPLPVLEKSMGVVRANILPSLSWFGRLTQGRRIISRLQGEAAILLRQNALPGAQQWMLRSIRTHPFHEPRRYRIGLHMLLHSWMNQTGDPRRLFRFDTAKALPAALLRAVPSSSTPSVQ